MINKNIALASAPSTSSGQSRLRRLWERYNSPIVWLVLVAYLAVAAFLVTAVFPVQFIDRSQSGFFEARGILAMAVMGGIGVWVSMQTGFPGAWDAKVTNRQRLLIPILAGILFGALFLATDLFTGMARLQQERFNVEATDIPFPASLFVYSAGSIFLEVVFRLLTIPLLLGLVSFFVRSPGGREKVFWILAILTSLLEPAMQSPVTQVLPALAWIFVLVQTFGFNLLQAAFFRKYGFLAAILARVAFYIPFHVIGSFLR